MSIKVLQKMAYVSYIFMEIRNCLHCPLQLIQRDHEELSLS